MGIPQPKQARHTIEEWRGWEGRWELIHGVAYDMTPAPSLEHQRTSAKLLVAISHALAAAKRKSGSGECEVFSAPVDLYLPGQESVLQPDLAVVCDPAALEDPRGIFGVPSLVVEILSPSTASKDMTRKRWAYEAAGVEEYLLVDPDEKIGVLLRLEAGRYQEVARVEWGAVVGLLGDRLPVTLG